MPVGINLRDTPCSKFFGGHSEHPFVSRIARRFDPIEYCRSGPPCRSFFLASLFFPRCRQIALYNFAVVARHELESRGRVCGRGFATGEATLGSDVLVEPSTGLVMELKLIL